MPKKKKNVINGFAVYMRELKDDLRKREGRMFPNGIADVVPIARPRWLALSEQEKDVYNRQAKEEKNSKNKDSEFWRQDNQGTILAEREDRHTVVKERRAKDRKYACSRWPSGEDIIEETFYFISFEYLCKTEDCDYLPLEVGLVEWSIVHGIKKTFQRFIDPGGIPLGYRYQCQSHSDETHQIPIDGFELASSDYRAIWNDLENFFDAPHQEYPPVYCLGTEEEWACVSFCLDWLHIRSGYGDGVHSNPLGKVFALEDMVCDVYMHASKSVSVSGAIDMLTTSVFDYEPNTRCKYHEEKETKHCALGTVRRYAYVLSDGFACVYDFELTDKHLPTQRDSTPSFTVIPASSVHIDAPLPYKDRSVGRGRPMVKCYSTGAFTDRDIRYQNVEEDDSDDDTNSISSTSKDQQSLHRNYSFPSVASSVQSQSWGSASTLTPSMADEDEFPSLGADPRKFAGRSNAPAAGEVPLPSWKAPAGASQPPPVQRPAFSAPRMPFSAPRKPFSAPDPPSPQRETQPARRTLRQAVQEKEGEAPQQQQQQQQQPLRPTLSQAVREQQPDPFRQPARPTLQQAVQHQQQQPDPFREAARPTLQQAVQQQQQQPDPFREPARPTLQQAVQHQQHQQQQQQQAPQQPPQQPAQPMYKQGVGRGRGGPVVPRQAPSWAGAPIPRGQGPRPGRGRGSPAQAGRGETSSNSGASSGLSSPSLPSESAGLSSPVRPLLATDCTAASLPSSSHSSPTMHLGGFSVVGGSSSSVSSVLPQSTRSSSPGGSLAGSSQLPSDFSSAARALSETSRRRVVPNDAATTAAHATQQGIRPHAMPTSGPLTFAGLGRGRGHAALSVTAPPGGIRPPPGFGRGLTQQMAAPSVDASDSASSVSMWSND